MDRAEIGNLLTQVGPDTPMGELMREYWIPAILSVELEPDGAPIRLKLLGEELIAFRTTSGKPAIFGHRCPHRCASLFYGRNEDDGIRCSFHGWKFDADGKCLDMPNVDNPGPTLARVRAKAYPTRELAGVVWAYMGRRADPPPLPEFPVFGMPSERITAWCEQRECNYLQCVEGELDTSHAGFLHLGIGSPESGSSVHGTSTDITARAVQYKVHETDYGLLAGGYRHADEDTLYWRFANFLLPFWTQPPPCQFGTEAVARAWVPMDDTHTMLFSISTDTFLMSHHPNAILPLYQPGLSFKYEFLPNDTDWYGRWRLAANPRNDFLIDRDVQKTGSYSGIEGLDVQDTAMQTSMGSIVDRTQEYLVAADLAVVQTRRRLQKAAMAHRDKAEVPVSVDRPQVYETWSGYIEAPADVDWLDLYRDSRPTADGPNERRPDGVRYGN